MQKILKHRWVLLILWVVVAVLFAVNQPDLKQILNQKGEATISENEPSQVAARMMDKLGNSKGNSILLVFNDDKKLSEKDMKDIEKGIDKLKEEKEKLQITNIMDPFGTPEAKEQLISKDNTTLLVQVSFEMGTRDSKTAIKDFENAVKDVNVTHYVTGDLAIKNDYMSDVATGVDKSAIITIAFILIVLILMFRSVVTPIVSLLAVGVSYICSMGIIGILVHKFNFPITSFTQMFVILVLFGIGTDYHILLFNRFKEELSNGLSVQDAVLTSYKTAGKTIIYSGLTVFVGFASLTFVSFPVYRSANAVAIGIAVLLIEIMTLTPLIMRILGGKLFWPSKNNHGHKESKFWGKASSFSVKHPVLSLGIVAVIIAPMIIFNTTKLSFNNIKDLSASDTSVKGFNIVVDKFSAGKVMQTTIILDNNEAMDNNDALAVIDNLTEKLKGLKGVKEVYGPTQPKGEVIEELYTNSQTKTVTSGLSDANDGIKKVQDGLTTMGDSLKTPDLSPVKELSEGTGTLASSMDAVTDGLKKVNGGIDQGAKGAEALTSGIAEIKAGVGGINSALVTISGKITEINNGYTQLGMGYKALPGSIEQLKELTAMMKVTVGKVDTKLPNDPDVAAVKGMIESLSAALNNLEAGINKANQNYDLLTGGLAQLNGGLKTIIDSTGPNSKLVNGINDLENGEKTLAEGLRKGSSGQEQIIASMAQLKTGAEKIKNGQDTLYNGLTTLSGGMSQLKDGIDKSNNGLETIHDGIGKSGEFLNQLTNTKKFYIPKEAFDKEDITKMFDAYMSKDRKTAKLTLTLASEPYSEEAIDTVKDINAIVSNDLNGTKLSAAKIGIAGATSDSYDLKNIATHDISFTQIMVLSAIFILLVIVIRSFWIPVYIIGSLVAAYYAALSGTAFLSKLLFESAKEGLSWNVPFFSFVMIAALGVDYSIFLMRRFREYPNLPKKEAIVLASRNIGGVVISAAVILAGTFATLYPSNIIVLMELAICVIIGLFLLSFVLLPMAVPALMSLTEKVSKRQEYSEVEEMEEAM